MFGVDISSYQHTIDLSTGTYDFAIVKATEGIGLKDSKFSDYVTQLTKLGKLIGCYHFARPDLNGTIGGMQKEADWFCNTVESAGLKERAILVLDWETEPMDRPDLIEAWTTRVEARMGTIPYIYGSKAKLTKWMSYQVIKKHPIWMAAWPTKTRYEVGQIDQSIGFPSTNPIPWTIWQYSSTGKFPGNNTNVDLDYCSLTPEQWKQWSGEIKAENISEDMRWAMDMGLFYGDGKGRYFPDQPLTREQAATVLHRYTDKVLKNVLNGAYGKFVTDNFFKDTDTTKE